MHQQFVSADQERLWYVSSVSDCANASMNIGSACEIHGVFEVNQLKSLITQVIKKHASLRCYFSEKGGEVVSNYAATVDIPLTVEQIQINPDESFEQQIAPYFYDFFEAPFDLTKPPLWRVKLLQIRPDFQAMFFVAHHIISDFRSVLLFFQEVQYAHELSLNPDSPLRLPLIDDGAEFAKLLEAHNKSTSYEKLAKISDFVATTHPMPNLGNLPRPASPSFICRSVYFPIEPAVLQQMKEKNLKQPIMLLAAFEVLIYQMTQVEKFLVGFPVEGRIGSAAKKAAMGFLVSPSVVRANVQGKRPLSRMTEQIKSQMTNAIRNRHVPFSSVSEIIERFHGRSNLPVLQLLFSHVPYSFYLDTRCTMQMPKIRCGPGTSNIDFWVTTVQVNETETLAQLDYNVDIFDSEYMAQVGEAFQSILKEIVDNPDIKIADISQAIIPNKADAEKEPPPRTIAIASSFTATPVEQVINNWADFFEQPIVCCMTPYQQVMQELLNPSSNLSNKNNVMNVLLVRLEDFFFYQQQEASRRKFEKVAIDFVKALKACVQRNPVPFFVGICPSQPEKVAHLLPLIERTLEQLRAIPGIQVVGSQEWLQHYQVKNIFDLASEQLAHIPYTEEFFTLVGTTIMRRWFALTHQRVKVIALDCDNTLWDGIIGEDGVDGIELDQHFLGLQRFMIKQHQSGVLLCLCSKNDARAVEEYFEQRDDSELQQAHIVAKKVNWLPKSKNIRELSQELNLGVDSFVFIDDNPIEIEEVSAHLPEAQCFVLPKDKKDFATFLNHLWLLDIHQTTKEDERRTQMYREEMQRVAFQNKQGGEFIDFIHGLQLEIDIHTVTSTEIPRTSQLTNRTNQFNFTTRARTEFEISALSRSLMSYIWVVCVKDRFGDYGLVGVMIGHLRDQYFELDSLLLSCRVLGRGIEHRMVAFLGEQAKSMGVQQLKLDAFVTERNTPALSFFKKLGEVQSGPDDVLTIMLNVEDAQATTLETDQSKIEHTVENQATTRTPQSQSRLVGAAKLGYLAQRMTTISDIMKEFEIGHSAESAVDQQAPQNHALSVIYAEMLNVTTARPDLNFFTAGGSSLDVVRLLSWVQSNFNKLVSIEDFVKEPTLTGLQRLLADSETIEEQSLLTLINKDMVLDPALLPPEGELTEQQLHDPKHIFLTGATGFLGSNLLNELLRTTNATIHCLVRSDAQSAAKKRVLQTFEKYQILWSPRWDDRVEFHSGDLGEDNLGLADASYAILSEQIDSIYHCAAYVNFILPYQQTRKTNVKGTMGILGFVAQGKLKVLHFVSTLGVLYNIKNFNKPELLEDTNVFQPADLPTGYQQTKFVAERLVVRAQERGFPIIIYRPGTIASHSKTGAFNPLDLWAMLMGAIFELKALPPINNIDLMPVDYIAKTIKKLSFSTNNIGRIFHLSHPQPLALNTITQWYRWAGFNLTFPSLDGWFAQLRQFIKDNPQSPIADLEPIVTNQDDPANNLLRLILGGPKVSTKNTVEALSKTNYTIPRVTREVMSMYYDVFCEKQWIDRADPTTLKAEEYLMWFKERMYGYCAAPCANTLDNNSDDEDNANALVTLDVEPQDLYDIAYQLGKQADQILEIDIMCYIENLYQLTKDRIVRLAGHVNCPLLHPIPLEITQGTLKLSPYNGVNAMDPEKLLFIQYKMDLIDSDGQVYHMHGTKFIETNFKFWQHVSTLNVRISDDKGNHLLTGRINIPTEVYTKDQIHGIQVNPKVPKKEHFGMKLSWLAFLGANIGGQYLKVALRQGLQFFGKM